MLRQRPPESDEFRADLHKLRQDDDERNKAPEHVPVFHQCLHERPAALFRRDTKPVPPLYR